jgi:hypothetical protein
MHLITKPIKPRRSPVINVRLADERYWSWKQFLDAAYWTVGLKWPSAGVPEIPRQPAFIAAMPCGSSPDPPPLG